MTYEIRHKTKGFAKTFATKEDVKAFLDEKKGRDEAWEGHENLNLAALETQAEFDRKFADHAAATQKASAPAVDNKPVRRAAAAKPAAKKAPAVKKVAQKTAVRKPAAAKKARK